MKVERAVLERAHTSQKAGDLCTVTACMSASVKQIVFLLIHVAPGNLG